MKKIIRGKKYDTDTATSICIYDNELPNDDFNYIYEELFIKRTGEYFLHGTGGAKTKYAKADGDMICGGSAIIPIEDEQAKEFIEKHSTPNVYERYFGEVSEGDTTKTNIKLSASAKKKLQHLALEKRVSISQIVERLIENA